MLPSSHPGHWLNATRILFRVAVLAQASSFKKSSASPWSHPQGVCSRHLSQNGFLSMVRQSMGGVAAVAAPQQPTDDGFAALPDLVDVFDDGPGDLQAVEAVVAADATMVGPPCGNWRVRPGGLIAACLVLAAPLVAATVR